ncbi:MAG: GNAT family N-acetyltransferase [Dehalococcoidales bacterium]|nr:GNAT family N-acetyltransferase [Dehalococcoidales bacterium]
MRLEIRPAAGADKPVIMRILQDTPEFKPFDVEVAAELLDAYLEDPSGSGYYVLVAEADAAVVGYICCGPTPLTSGTWDVYWMAVARPEQGQGIGQALLSSAEAKIKETQARLVLIETSSKPNYEKTRRFYQSQGYEIISHIPDFYEPGDDKLTFQKRLG